MVIARDGVCGGFEPCRYDQRKSEVTQLNRCYKLLHAELKSIKLELVA
jgi:hypothetical protein